MKILLDTHLLLWALSANARLSEAQSQAIEEGEVYLSAASIWEIGTKRHLGKLDVPGTYVDVAVDAGCRPLPVNWSHADAAAALPPHHADPFDRMLIAQARCEGLTLLSSDRKMRDYEVPLID